MSGSWLVPFGPQAPGRPVLLCLASAGAGCGQFAAWQDELNAAASVVGVQLPGREGRWAEPMVDKVTDAVGAVVAELPTVVSAEEPLVVFGHSFGALLGYEVVRALEQRNVLSPSVLVAAACRPPRQWIGAGRGLADDESELGRLLDARALDVDSDDDPEARELAMEVLRKDVQLSLSYQDPGKKRLCCALEAWGGENDETVRAEHVMAWKAHTRGAFRCRRFPGGHDFCLPSPGPALAVLTDLLDAARTWGMAW